MHAAGVLDDGILLQLDAQRFRVGDGAQGAGRLESAYLTDGTQLDFFVTFSSVASFLISAGHGNYATANAFLDALADVSTFARAAGHVHQLGRLGRNRAGRGTTDRLERLSERGLKTLSSADGLRGAGRGACGSTRRVAVMHFDARAWCAAPDLATPTSLFSHLLAEPKPRSGAHDPTRAAKN